MINLSTNREKFILKPTIPSGTTDVSYTVSIGGNLVFLGKSKYFGGDYEVDCSDWIASYIASKTQPDRPPMTKIHDVHIHVVFTYSGGTSQTMDIHWYEDRIYLEDITISSPYAVLGLFNCGYYIDLNNTYLYIPLTFHNGILDGKTTNILDKVTYTDKYGDTHNASVTNHYELECFIDPCWLHTETGDRNDHFEYMDIEYEKVMMALQNSPYTILVTNGINISGVEEPYSQNAIEVHIKDVEQVETYSSYSTDKKVPTLKITLEVLI